MIGLVLNELESLGLAQDTAVAVFEDHKYESCTCTYDSERGEREGKGGKVRARPRKR
jgi:hypothetical protein